MQYFDVVFSGLLEPLGGRTLKYFHALVCVAILNLNGDLWANSLTT